VKVLTSNNFTLSIVGADTPLSENAYYESLIAGSLGSYSIHDQAAYSSVVADPQAEVEADYFGSNYDPNSVVYDATEDAAKWIWPAGSRSKFTGSLRRGFSGISSGDWLAYWEYKWGDGWDTDLGDMHTHKEFMITDTGNDNREIEVRTRYSGFVDGDVGYCDIRTYQLPGGGQPIGVPSSTSSDTLKIGIWHRYWLYYDHALDRLTLWIGDEQTAPRKIYDQFQFGSNSFTFNGFEYRLNSSQTGSGSVSEIYSWGRNYVTVTGVGSLAAAQSIVDAGSQV